MTQTPRKRLTVLTALALLLTMLGLTPQAASVGGTWVKPNSAYGSDAYGTHIVGYVTQIPVPAGWMGSYTLKSTSTAELYSSFYCLDVTKDHPYKTSYAYPYRMDADRDFVTDFGRTLTDTDKKKIAFLINRYGTTTDKGTAAAVATVLYDLEGNASYDLDNPNSNGYRRLAAHSSALLAKAKQIKADTLSNYGTYGVNTKVTPTAVKPGQKVTATATLTHASGGSSVSALDGMPVTFTFTNGVQTGTAKANTTDGAATATFTVPFSGSWTASASVAELPADSANVMKPADADSQRTVTSDARVVVKDSTPAAFTSTVFSPTVTTASTLNISATAPQSVKDTITISGGKPSTAFSGTSVLYGPLTAPPAPSAAAPSGTPAVGTATFSGTYSTSGTATVTSTALTVNKQGYYVWRETLNGVSAVSNARTGSYGVPAETSLIYMPKLSTTVSDTTVLPGDTISDSVTRVNFYGTFRGVPIQNTITDTLYSQAPGATSWTKMASPTPTVRQLNTNGTDTGWTQYTIPKTAPMGTKYSYQATLSWWADFNSNGTRDPGETGSFLEDPGVASQTATVVAVRSPKLTTVTSKTSAVVGATVTDTVTISNPDSLPGTMTAMLYGPAAPEGTDCSSLTDADWQSLISAGTVKAISTQTAIVLTGKTSVTTAAVSLPAPGCYTWYEKATFTAPSGSQLVVETAYGVASETTFVPYPPAMATQVSALQAKVGDTVHDAITVTGTQGQTGTIQAIAYGPLLPPIAGDCSSITAADWSAQIASGAAAVLSSETLSITGDDDYTTAEVTLPSRGCVTWYEKMTLADTTVVTTALGESTETTLVLDAAVTATASTLLTAPSTTVSGSIVVTGTEGQEGTVTAVLYGMATPDDNQDCSSLSPDDWLQLIDEGTVKALSTQTIPIRGDGTYTTTAANLPAAGCATWQETLALSGGVTVTTELGDASETTLVLAPTLSTQVSDTFLKVGDTLNATITVTGAQGQAGSIEAVLYGTTTPPTAGDCASITAADWSSRIAAGTVEVLYRETLPVLGDGDYTTQDAQAPTKGCVIWSAEVTFGPVTVTTPLDATQVPALVVNPTLVTTTSKAVVSPGATVTDTVVVSGTEGRGGTLEAILYGMATPEANKSCTSLTEDAWATAVAAGTVTVLGTQTLALTGDGTYTTAAVAVPRTGCATWYEHAVLNDSSGSSVEVETPLGVPSETTLAIAPTFTTRASISSAVQEQGLISDQLMVTGTQGQGGTATVKLLGPVAPNASYSCSTVSWGAAPVVHTFTVPVTGDGTYFVPTAQPGKAGCYTYQTTLTMSAPGVTPVSDVAGLAAETVRLVDITPKYAPPGTTTVPRFEAGR